MVQDMDKETGDHQEMEEISMLECIRMIRNVDMVDIYGQMVVFMKVTSKMTLSKKSFII